MRKKKICFITGTRADYGILAPVMREVAECPFVELQIIATNMHLSPDYGMTANEIENDGFKIDFRIESLDPGGTAAATVRSMAKVELGLADAFETFRPDMVVILGDRYEALAAASAAVVFDIPVAHLHGGETTEGAIDDMFRHAITKLSTYHFASTQQYRENIISMGEDRAHVFHSGAPGAEGYNLFLDPLSDIASEFYEKTGIKSGEEFIILAYHPVTRLADKGLSELIPLLQALDSFIAQGYKILATMPNSDPGTKEIGDTIRKWAATHPGKISLKESLGSKLFHYALDHAVAIVGNSSAALIEAPTHRLGAANIGIRQKGRAKGLTVIDAGADKAKIEETIHTLLSFEMKSVLMGLPVTSLNPYYKENSSSFIASRLIKLLIK